MLSKSDSDPDYWLFGYGSLIWRPDFEFAERHQAHVRHWQRRFWQASPDHRGVPEAPGRVVTLVEAPGAECVGVAYRVDAARWPQVVDALDIREQNGYELVRFELHLAGGRRVPGVTYVAGPHNPSFVGAAPLHEMAAQILSAHGPSGPNREYLERLAQALEDMQAVDEEILALMAAIADIDQAQSGCRTA